MSDREKLISGLRGILKEIQDSGNIEGMKMQIVKMQLDLERLEREVNKIPLLPTRAEFWTGIIAVSGLFAAVLALVK